MKKISNPYKLHPWHGIKPEIVGQTAWRCYIEVVPGDARRVHHLGHHTGKVECQDARLEGVRDPDRGRLVWDEEAPVLQEVCHAVRLLSGLCHERSAVRRSVQPFCAHARVDCTWGAGHMPCVAKPRGV